MSVTTATQPPTAHEDTPAQPVLYIALELSARSWRAHASCRGRGSSQKSLRSHIGALGCEIARLRRRFGLDPSARVVTCYEASFQGFSVHRSLEQLGIENYVVDPKMLARRRQHRGKVAKTDRLDGEELLSCLVRYDRDGEERDLSWVRVPTPQQEDLRRLQRCREHLIRQRNVHAARIRSLLETVGISIRDPEGLTSEELEGLECAPGNALGPYLRFEIEKAIEQLALVKSQIGELERVRRRELEEGKSESMKKARRLQNLRGIGPNIAMTLIAELGWREYRNGKELGASVGLAPTPHQSGEQSLERGISKAGNRRVRRVMIEAAWLWLRWQPQSDLSRWYESRFSGTRRGKRIGITALARKLLNALWRYWEYGVVPNRAIVSV
jgi:transposase